MPVCVGILGDEISVFTAHRRMCYFFLKASLSFQEVKKIKADSLRARIPMKIT